MLGLGGSVWLHRFDIACRFIAVPACQMLMQHLHDVTVGQAMPVASRLQCCSQSLTQASQGEQLQLLTAAR